MFEYILTAIQNIFTTYGLFLSLAGAAYGMVLGAIPGLNATTALILVLPLTYSMDHIYAFVLLMAVWIGGISGGYIGSILVGIPGTVGSVATVYDGYEMTKKARRDAHSLLPQLQILLVPCRV